MMMHVYIYIYVHIPEGITHDNTKHDYATTIIITTMTITITITISTTITITITITIIDRATIQNMIVLAVLGR